MELQGYTNDVSIVARCITGTIDGTNTEHADVIRHFSCSARTGWMEGWENRQEEMVLREMLAKNPDSKHLSDVCKAAYTVHLYKDAPTSVGGCAQTAALFAGLTDSPCGLSATLLI